MVVIFLIYVCHWTEREINLSGPIMKYYPSISVELLRKTTKTLLSIVSHRVDFQSGQIRNSKS
jgi:hypothetical protein